MKANIVSLRLHDSTIDFLDRVRGNLTQGQAVKKFVEYIELYGDTDYARNILGADNG